MPQELQATPTIQGRRRYAKIEAAADYIDVRPCTIRAMLTDGRLTPYKLGNRVIRVDLNEIDAVMADP
jgi:hypothetical protein